MNREIEICSDPITVMRFQVPENCGICGNPFAENEWPILVDKLDKDNELIAIPAHKFCAENRKQ